MGKSLDEIWKKIEKKKAEDRDREYKEFYSKELKILESRKSIREFSILHQSSGNRYNLPNDFIVISSVKKTGIDSPFITYKTKSGYRELDLSRYVSGVSINNTNEIVRFGQNDLFVIGNWAIPSGPIVVSLLNCRLVNDELIPGEVKWRSIPELTNGCHGSDYDRVNGFIYMCNFTNYVVGFTVGRIDPRDLDNYSTYKFPNTGQFIYSPTDVICANGFAYMLYGSNGGGIARFGSGTLTPTILYALSSSLAYSIYFDTPFAIDPIENELYYTTIYATGTNTQRRNTIGIVVIDLNTGALKRRRNLQSIGSSGTNFPWPHWMEVYNGKIFVTMVGTFGNRQLIRYDSQTLLLEEVYQNDTGVSDDNLIVGDYVYICQEDSVSMPTPPNLLKINLYDFNDRVVEISNLNDGFGSYGAVKDVWVK